MKNKAYKIIEISFEDYYKENVEPILYEYGIDVCFDLYYIKDLNDGVEHYEMCLYPEDIESVNLYDIDFDTCGDEKTEEVLKAIKEEYKKDIKVFCQSKRNYGYKMVNIHKKEMYNINFR